MITGYGTISTTEAECLLYVELIHDLYHAIDGLKNDKIKNKKYWIEEIEKVLEQLGTPRPKFRRAGPRNKV